MGQYFLVINKTKKEYLHPHDADNGLKFMEIVGSFGTANILTYLLRQSTGSGGGDIDIMADIEETQRHCEEEIQKAKQEGNNQRDIDFYSKYIEGFEKRKKLIKKQKYVGTWVNDQIAIVGDYDESALYDTAEKSFKNITSAVIAEIKEQCDIDILDNAEYTKTLKPDMVIAAAVAKEESQ